jgi:hypothetical protein
MAFPVYLTENDEKIKMYKFGFPEHLKNILINQASNDQELQLGHNCSLHL